MVDGLPADVNLVKLIEESAPDDAKLDQQLDIYDTCGKEKCNYKFWLLKPLNEPPIILLASDACETSAKVFKCGVDKDPSGMANLIESSSKNKAEESAVRSLSLD